MLPGSAPPRVRHCPPRAGEIGETVVLTALGVGLDLDEWQRDLIRDAMSVDPLGRWATPRVGVSVPRQNGKGAVIEAIEIAFFLGVFADARLLIHSAHEYKTAQNGFQRLLSYFETVPALAAARDAGQVKIGTAAAREFVTVTVNGVTRTVKFMARSKGSGRGFSADILILDEAQELAEQVFAAILPTVSARPNPQIWLFGTPPDETMNGEVFTRFRSGGLEGVDKRLAYFEWSAPDDADPSDPATWASANPAFGLRISEEGVRDEFNAMEEDTFGRERLGQHDALGGRSVIPSDTWEALVAETDPVGRVAFAIDVSPDRSRASIAVAGFVGDGVVMVQAIDNRKGTGWVAHRVKELTERHPHVAVVVDSAGPAASLVPALKQARVKRIVVLGTRDVVQACGQFFDAAMQGALRHPDQPLLNDALAGARKRPIGDAWGWTRKGSAADITPLVAVTFALHGLLAKGPRADAPTRRAVVL